MHKLIFILFFLFSSSSFAFDYKLEVKKINNNTWCFLGKTEAPSKENGGFMSNSCYVQTKNNYVLIDSGATYEFAKQSYEIMSKIKKLPVNMIILTHEHDDHWLGSSYYKEKFNSKILGPSLINTNYTKDSKTRMFKILSEDAIKNTKIIRVDKSIKEKTEIKIDDTIFTIVPIKTKAHTDEDLFVYVHNSKIVFSGDLVMNERITSNRHGSVIGQLKAIDMINSYDYEYLVPGHGQITDKTAIKESQEYFTLLKQRVIQAIEEDIGADTVTNVIKMKEFEKKALYKQLNKRNVFDAYGELEFYEEE